MADTTPDPRSTRSDQPEGDKSDQSWFWSPAWQAGEREVDEHIAAGRVTDYDGVEAFLAALERHRDQTDGPN